MLAVVVTGVFATRIGITYNGVEYILNTSRAISADNTAYFSGMYDGFACVQQGYDLNEIYEIVSTKTFSDVEDPAAAKQEYEDAVLDLAGYLKAPASFYTADELNSVPGEFSESTFVRSVTDVDCVCERSAARASGGNSFLMRKTAEDGMTVAVCSRAFEARFV